MNRAPRDQIGLALGAWGASQATAAGLGVALGGVIRDIVATTSNHPATGYHVVYGLEIVLLLVTLVSAAPLLAAESRDAARSHAGRNQRGNPGGSGIIQEGSAL